MKKAGILLPLQSLNGEHGVGDFGKKAYEFIDIIKKSGFDMWQILPLNPLGYGNSPYQPYSSFAGDEIYISLDLLYEDGLLDKKIEKISQKEREKQKYPKLRYTIYRTFGLLYVYAKENDSFDRIAQSLDFKVKDLKKFNEVPEDFPLQKGDIVYLEKKKS